MSPDSGKGPQIVIFGCRLNSYESEVMHKMARDAGMGSETVIVNSCAVTGEAERQLRQAVRKLRRENPESRIVVAGCAAQIDPERYSGMEEVDAVVGNYLKLKPDVWKDILAGGDRVFVTDIMSVGETEAGLVEGMEGRARAFLQAQNGCDHRCTFCIVPYGRGNSRSVPVRDIIRQARKFVDSGYREIVLTGVDITSYGADLSGIPHPGRMIGHLLSTVPELERLRLSSLDPVGIDEDLWRLIESEPRLMPHLHLSIQAGDDMILKRMKRRHRRSDIIDVCSRARALRSDMVFGADIIAGFPTETEEMFSRSMDIVRECDLTFLHVFPFSPRPGTPAARMPQLPKKVVKERAARLRSLGERQLAGHMKRRVGLAEKAVVEQGRTGRTEHFFKIRLDRECIEGEIVEVEVIRADNDELFGTIKAAK